MTRNIRPTTGLRARLRRSWAGVQAGLPTQAQLSQQRWLRPLAHRLSARELWRMKPEPLARGVAIGLFWAFALPFAQILAAAAHCVWWRGNIPVAAAATLVTNPLTVGGWLWLAYQLGNLFVPAAPPLLPGDDLGWWAWLQSFGAPALLGMGLFAVFGALLGYLVVKLVAWLLIGLRLRRRSRRQQQRSRSTA